LAHPGTSQVPPPPGDTLPVRADNRCLLDGRGRAQDAAATGRSHRHVCRLQIRGNVRASYRRLCLHDRQYIYKGRDSLNGDQHS